MPVSAPVAAPTELHRSPWTSVKLRLALIGALLIAASVALTVTLALRAVDQHREQVAIDLSLVQTRKMAKLVSARLVSLQLSLRSAATAFDTQQPLKVEPALAFLRNRPVLMSLFDTVFVSRPDGHVVAFRDGQGTREPTLFIGDREYFRQTIAQQRPIISQPTVGRASNEPVVILTLPLRGEHGRIVAVIGGGIRLATRDLMPEITASDEDDPARTIIVDSGGACSHTPSANG